MPFGIRPSNVRVCHSTTRALYSERQTFRRRQWLASLLSLLIPTPTLLVLLIVIVIETSTRIPIRGIRLIRGYVLHDEGRA